MKNKPKTWQIVLLYGIGVILSLAISGGMIYMAALIVKAVFF